MVSSSDAFFCPGYKIVEDRRIRCHKVGGHGSENFIQGTMNSCNPVFMEVGLRLGPERMYDYFQKFGLLEKTGVDLPGEAGTIMHKKDAIGQVELAHHFLWPVLPDHSVKAADHGQFPCQRRPSGDTPPGLQCEKPGRGGAAGI